ncbi:MAG: hypothetical protein M3T96_09635 [Acidobacteriota bacterium]|nr:hypothetical protein [Acidobacteriota bacterium]
MKLIKSFTFLFLSFSLFSVSFLSLTPRSVCAQDTKIALQRGYRTGYSDGYMSGYRDTIDNAAKSVENHGEYAAADRAYLKDYGTRDDYRDGYQQGFETGYNTGFEKRSFDAALPNNLNRRGIVAVKTPNAPPVIEEKVPETIVAETTAPPVVEQPAVTTTEQVSENTPTATVEEAKTAEQTPMTITRTQYNPVFSNSDTAITIPTDTELIVEILSDINTERSAAGDKFQARIVSPNELNGAIIEGKISKITKPGRIKRRSEVLLSFDRIILSEQRWSNFNAIVTEVLPRKGDNIKRVDTEGTVEGQSSVKSDSVKVGAATGTGLVIGAIAGGPVGAAVGAGVGAAFGVGAVVVDRGKDIRINKDQQLRIKTVYETQIR